jgi:hypothetical protein
MRAAENPAGRIANSTGESIVVGLLTGGSGAYRGGGVVVL